MREPANDFTRSSFPIERSCNSAEGQTCRMRINNVTYSNHFYAKMPRIYFHPAKHFRRTSDYMHFLRPAHLGHACRQQERELKMIK